MRLVRSWRIPPCVSLHDSSLCDPQLGHDRADGAFQALALRLPPREEALHLRRGSLGYGGVGVDTTIQVQETETLV